MPGAVKLGFRRQGMTLLYDLVHQTLVTLECDPEARAAR